MGSKIRKRIVTSALQDAFYESPMHDFYESVHHDRGGPPWAMDVPGPPPIPEDDPEIGEPKTLWRLTKDGDVAAYYDHIGHQVGVNLWAGKIAGIRGRDHEGGPITSHIGSSSWHGNDGTASNLMSLGLPYDSSLPRDNNLRVDRPGFWHAYHRSSGGGDATYRAQVVSAYGELWIPFRSLTTNWDNKGGPSPTPNTGGIVVAEASGEYGGHFHEDHIPWVFSKGMGYYSDVYCYGFSPEGVGIHVVYPDRGGIKIPKVPNSGQPKTLGAIWLSGNRNSLPSHNGLNLGGSPYGIYHCGRQTHSWTSAITGTTSPSSTVASIWKISAHSGEVMWHADKAGGNQENQALLGIAHASTSAGYGNRQIAVCGPSSGGASIWCLKDSDGSDVWERNLFGSATTTAVASGGVEWGMDGPVNWIFAGTASTGRVYKLNTVDGSTIWEWHMNDADGVGVKDVMRTLDGGCWVVGQRTDQWDRLHTDP